MLTFQPQHANHAHHSQNPFPSPKKVMDPWLISEKRRVCESDDGKPWAFAAKSYSTGKLYFFDPKVEEPEAKATFIGGGPDGLDIRHTDLSEKVNNEKANRVETLVPGLRSAPRYRRDQLAAFVQLLSSGAS